MAQTIRILGVGSLQARSNNLALLHAAAAAAPAGVEIVVSDGLGDLPHVNPDMETTATSYPVERWRRALADGEGLVIVGGEPMVLGPDFERGVAALVQQLVNTIHVDLPH